MEKEEGRKEDGLCNGGSKGDIRRFKKTMAIDFL
jgi:hypothetical protein